MNDAPAYGIPGRPRESAERRLAELWETHVTSGSTGWAAESFTARRVQALLVTHPDGWTTHEVGMPNHLDRLVLAIFHSLDEHGRDRFLVAYPWGAPLAIEPDEVLEARYFADQAAA